MWSPTYHPTPRISLQGLHYVVRICCCGITHIYAASNWKKRTWVTGRLMMRITCMQLSMLTMQQTQTVMQILTFGDQSRNWVSHISGPVPEKQCKGQSDSSTNTSARNDDVWILQSSTSWTTTSNLHLWQVENWRKIKITDEAFHVIASVTFGTFHLWTFTFSDI